MSPNTGVALYLGPESRKYIDDAGEDYGYKVLDYEG
jgi:hypothetical protein